MAKNLKSPGVYIEDINAFPASIGQVASAIPAFIGFTETLPHPNKPTKIGSLLDYQQIFGGAPDPESFIIDLDKEDYQVAESRFKLYNSLRLFFANGGSECYIVSIGTYDNTNWQEINSGTFIIGIDYLEKIDEVTLIAFPDAVNLTATNLGQVQVHALKQCADLMDRFTIMDVIQEDTGNVVNNCTKFRDAIGNRNLNYGAAYYPYLQTNFIYRFRFDLIAETANFKKMYASDFELLSSIDDFQNLYGDIHNSNGGILKIWEEAVRTNQKLEDVESERDVNEYYKRLWNLLAVLGQPERFSHEKLKDILKEAIQVTFKPIAQKLVDLKIAYEKLKEVDGEGNLLEVTPLQELDKNLRFKAPWDNISGYSTSNPNTFDKEEAISTPEGNLSYSNLKVHLDRIYGQIESSMTFLTSSIKEYRKAEENNLTAQIPVYPKIISGLSQAMNTVPPSGAIAGIYANVDATRGVWKAPANISVNGIIGLTDDITEREQRDMNVHESGKSINAIRKFTARGLLVWGARTLDGNSNDRRYVNVMRLAIMIEESVKKACMKFVFEPNVKQTWVSVKGIIENYLSSLWSDGALAGAKPEDAFFVSVGLNQTMTADDIHNGRMIVKLGCAPSRPAEFIVLEFTQQQQKP